MTIPHFQKALKCFLKVIDCTQVGFEKALGAVKVIKDQIQYRSQSLLKLALGYFNSKNSTSDLFHKNVMTATLDISLGLIASNHKVVLCLTMTHSIMLTATVSKKNVRKKTSKILSYKLVVYDDKGNENFTYSHFNLDRRKTQQ